MSAAELAKRFQAVAEEYPSGAIVWHRASGKRGVVVEWAIDGGGCVMVVIDWGQDHWEKCLPCALSATKILVDFDDEPTVT